MLFIVILHHGKQCTHESKHNHRKMKIIIPSFTNLQKAYDKFVGGGFWGIFTFGIVYGVAEISEAADRAEDFSHRY